MKVDKFENAKFGDAFLTRDGRKALYVKHLNKMSVLIVDGEFSTAMYFSDGCYRMSGNGDPLDIVGSYDLAAGKPTSSDVG